MNYLRRASGLWCPDYHLRFPPERGFAQPNYSILPGHFPAGAVARAGDSAPISLVFTHSDITTGGNQTSWPNVPIGDAASDRLVIVAPHGAQFGNPTFGALTVGGISATKLGEVDASNNTAAMFAAVVPTGTDATVSWTYSSGSGNRNGLAVYALYNYVSNTPHDSDFPTGGNGALRTATIDVPAGGAALGIAFGKAGEQGAKWLDGRSEDFFELTSKDFQGGVRASTATTLTDEEFRFDGCRGIMAASWS